MQVESATLTGIVDTLVAKGWLERSESTEDNAMPRAAADAGGARADDPRPRPRTRSSRRACSARPTPRPRAGAAPPRTHDPQSGRPELIPIVSSVKKKKHTVRHRAAVSLRVQGRRTFSSLKVRNYRLYFIGQTISLCGTWMQVDGAGAARPAAHRLRHRARARDRAAVRAHPAPRPVRRSARRPLLETPDPADHAVDRRGARARPGRARRHRGRAAVDGLRARARARASSTRSTTRRGRRSCTSWSDARSSATR